MRVGLFDVPITKTPGLSASICKRHRDGMGVMGDGAGQRIRLHVWVDLCEARRTAFTI